MTKYIKVLPLSDSNLDEVVGFVARLNKNNAHHISDFGETEAEVREDLAAILPPEGDGYLALTDNGEIAGLLGVEIDSGLGRCWLLGPIVQHSAWDLVADALYDKILAIVPEKVNDQQISFDAANHNVERFALRHDFSFYTEALVLSMDKDGRHSFPLAAAPEYEEKFAAEFTALHAKLFPNTYYSGEQLIKLTQDRNVRLFIHTVSGNLTGYIFIQSRKSYQDAYIDFLGVDERMRRKGIGKKLLASSLNWAFSRPEVEKVTLTVRTSDKPAIRLYESMKFKVERRVMGYRKRN